MQFISEPQPTGAAQQGELSPQVAKQGCFILHDWLFAQASSGCSWNKEVLDAYYAIYQVLHSISEKGGRNGI